LGTFGGRPIIISYFVSSSYLMMFKNHRALIEILEWHGMACPRNWRRDDVSMIYTSLVIVGNFESSVVSLQQTVLVNNTFYQQEWSI